MKTTTVSQAKNGLSALLDRVKAGETVLVTDRGVPVARIEPVTTSTDPSGRRERLLRAGMLTPASAVLPAGFLDGPTVRLPHGTSAVRTVLDERRTGW